MAKQKCGTCRFFQEAGLAGSGWCHHPQRKVSSDVMIMVRRNELACRDEWSRSLWAPAESASREAGPIFQRPLNHGPVSPADADELRALAQISERELPQTAGEDVLLSEARIIAEPRERIHLAPKSPAFDVRSAVFRAREAYRERNRARDVAARMSEGVTPLPAEEGEVGWDEAQFSSANTRGVTADLEGHGQTAEEFEAEASVTAAEESLGAGVETGRRTPPDAIAPHARALHESESSAIERYNAPDNSLSRFLDSDAADVEDEFALASNPELQLANLYQLASEPLPAWFRNDLPRICRTCRDYRPTADGRRGWCANSWAFSHPRLVNEEDVAPCDSAFGDWWAAVDDVWLVAADVSTHTRPTPLLDRMIALNDPTRKQSQGTS